MKRWCLSLLLTVTASAQQWAPPQEPDPGKILDEAREDAREGRHEIALAKHVWYHQNALKYDPALVGVRLSFALSSWAELGKAYPPALSALKDARDEALRKATRPSGTMSFFDFASINRELGEEGLTRDVFVQLDADKDPAAAIIFELARPALIKHKEYELCLKYLKPKETFLQALAQYRLQKQWAADGRFGDAQGDFAEKSLTNSVATIVGLLAVSGRAEEAEQIARDARKEWDNAEFHAAIRKALAGNVPPPWP